MQMRLMLHQFSKHRYQAIKALLMRFGACCQDQGSARRQAIVRSHPRFPVWQWPNDGVREQQLTMNAAVLTQPLSCGSGLHQMQISPWIRQTPKQSPRKGRWLSRRIVAFRHDGAQTETSTGEKQLHRRKCGHSHRKISPMAAQQ